MTNVPEQYQQHLNADDEQDTQMLGEVEVEEDSRVDER